MSATISNIKVARLPKRLLACVTHVGPYKENPQLFEGLFKKVIAWAAPKGLMQNPDLEAISVYHDDPDEVPEDQHRICVGFTVPMGTPTNEDITLLDLPEGKYVIGEFEILPNEYGKAWSLMYDFIKDQNLRQGKVMYESYKNDPHAHPEGKHVVDICVAIE
jgi:AraC family transcriptional regulator